MFAYRSVMAIALIWTAWLAASNARSVRGADPLQVRVLSYNIHHAEGVDRKLDVERIARVIRSVSPDIVALQEVDRRVKRTSSVDQPAELARLTEMHVVFGGNIDLQGGQYGNALLSRYPILRHKNHLLPNIGESEQRGVLEAEVRHPDWPDPLLVYATHLDYRPDNRERLASATAINELVAQHPNRHALLAGDLNDTPNSEPLKRLGANWTSANAQPLATIPVDRPSSQIDFILYRPKDRWKTVEVKVLEEAIASDHRAILAVLQANGT